MSRRLIEDKAHKTMKNFRFTKVRIKRFEKNMAEFKNESFGFVHLDNDMLFVTDGAMALGFDSIPLGGHEGTFRLEDLQGKTMTSMWFRHESKRLPLSIADKIDPRPSQIRFWSREHVESILGNLKRFKNTAESLNNWMVKIDENHNVFVVDLKLGQLQICTGANNPEMGEHVFTVGLDRFRRALEFLLAEGGSEFKVGFSDSGRGQPLRITASNDWVRPFVLMMPIIGH